MVIFESISVGSKLREEIYFLETLFGGCILEAG
jgi:hypothetical protein